MPLAPFRRPSTLPARSRAGRLPFATCAAAVLLLLSACGGGGDGAASAPEAPSDITLSGSVAVGAPMTGGTVRVLDAGGTVVASDIAIDDDGRYTVPELTGSGPYRIEACGYAGPNYQCIYSVAQGPGTAHVTPLTTATVLLASGRSPADLMAGDGSTLDAGTVETAQQQLRNGLAGVLDGHVAADFDFVAGDLSAGSRAGYDRVLDAIGVNTGIDADHPFVQITPRMGSGNLYLEQGSTLGSVSADSRADSLPLTSLETLFRGMSAALASPEACASPTHGIATHLAAGARMAMDGDAALEGAAAVGAGLCQFFATDEMWGSRLLSPTLGRCDLDGAQPVCRVSFVLQGTDGSVQQVGGRMGVTFEGGAWKFLGDLDPIALHAGATAQRDRRIDGATPVDSYSRALAFDIPALSGLQCARVSQHDADGQTVTVAYYKRYGDGVQRLSLWTDSEYANTRSIDPAVGHLRSGDDTWIMLPEGTEGDAVIRNFFRGGRNVTVSLFSDSGCTSVFDVGGRSTFEVEVEGLPPVWSAMSTLPWPELVDASRNAIVGLELAAGASAQLSLAWTYDRGPLGIGEMGFCSDRATCGEGGAGRIGDASLRPGVSSKTLTLTNGASAVASSASKMLSLYGRNGEGLMLQSNYLSCSGTSSGEMCR